MSEAAKPETVSVKSLQWHTTGGVVHDVGDVYDIAADLVDSVIAQGKAERAAATAPPPPAPRKA